jgi:hypothetical protein
VHAKHFLMDSRWIRRMPRWSRNYGIILHLYVLLHVCFGTTHCLFSLRPFLTITVCACPMPKPVSVKVDQRNIILTAHMCLLLDMHFAAAYLRNFTSSYLFARFVPFTTIFMHPLYSVENFISAILFLYLFHLYSVFVPLNEKLP